MNINAVKKLSEEKFMELHEDFYSEKVNEIVSRASSGYYIAKLKVADGEIDKYTSLKQKLKSEGYNCEIKIEKETREVDGYELLKYVRYLIVDWTN